MLFLNWSTGVLLTGYALVLGASPGALAVLGGLPFLAQLLAPLALFLRGSRKALAARLNLLARALFLPAVLVPFLPEALRVPGLLLFAGLSQLLAAPVGVLWLSWMADLVPEEKRGRYFGLRNALLGVVGTLGNLLGGAVADRLPPPLGYQAVLLLGVALGLGGLVGSLGAGGLARLSPDPSPYHLPILASTALRLLAALSLRRLAP
uniref:MFS transporter n=1 Tax=Thermus islandicus TaxID=540988 RepID=A0A831UMU3_9DEIN